jgi:hypothetical protein
MDTKTKYFIYKKKYLNLKKKQIGGARFITIPNNGGAGPGTANQCIWIIIRDYLNYHRGQDISVTTLKRMIGLDPKTDLLEYDDNNPVLRQGLLKLVEILGITLCFIYTKHDGSIAPFCLNADGTLHPARIINPGTGDDVYIATFGGHFELIVEIPQKYLLVRNPNSTITNQKVYEPKIKIHNTYVAETDINDEQIIIASVRLFELIEQIEYFEIEIKRLKSSINDNEENIKKMYRLDLDLEDKIKLEHMYTSEYKENNVRYIKLRKILDDLIDEKLSLDLIING